MSEQTPPNSRRKWLAGSALLGAGLITQQAQSASKSTGPKTIKGKNRPKLAVVFGGGSVRGFAHIGVIKALEAAGIKPDAIFGCSAGALVGAFWAAGYSGWKMEALAYQVKEEEVIDLVAGNASNRVGMVTGYALQKFVQQGTGSASIEKLDMPFRAIATEFPSGRAQIFSNGDLGFAVRASCSIPGIFMPARANGKKYLDGGLVSPMPVSIARDEGYDLVVAVDVGGADPGDSESNVSGLYQILLRSFDIMGDSLRRVEAQQASILIRPDVSRIKSTDFAARRALVEAGNKAAERLAPVIKEKMRG